MVRDDVTVRRGPWEPVPLTPIQHWFFEGEPPEPAHFNLAMEVELDPSVNPERLERALQVVVEHHDAFRLRFRRDGDRWLQELAPERPRVSLERWESSRVAELHQGFSLERGPLLRAALIQEGAAPAKLLLVAHHLIIDVVSFGILLEEVEQVYEQLAEGEEDGLPPSEVGFVEWARHLEAWAGSPECAAALDFWSEVLAAPCEALPREGGEGPDTFASLREVRVALGREETDALVRRGPKAHGARLHELLIHALGRGLTDWASVRSLLLSLEGHGRESPLGEDLDLSRTIGWLTSFVPFRVEAGEPLSSTLARLRRIPGEGQGVDYGALRYLSGTVLPEALSARPEVSFNFVGHLGGERTGLFGPPRLAEGGAWSPRLVRRHLIEVNAGLMDGTLTLAFWYSHLRHREEAIEALGQAVLTELRSLIVDAPGGHGAARPPISGKRS